MREVLTHSLTSRRRRSSSEAPASGEPSSIMAEHLLAGPTLVDELDLEYSVHNVPRSYRDEVRSVVHPGILSDDDFERLRIVCTCQRAREDLVKMGEKVRYT